MNARVFAPLTALLLAAGSLAATVAPAAAQAYPYSYSYPSARAPQGSHDLRGVVAGFGGYSMTLNIRRGSVPVQLHRGTIIEPIGTTLQPGMRVNVHGYWSNGTFVANRIAVF